MNIAWHSRAKGPTARREAILELEVNDEVLLYDTRSQRAHALNRAAAEVWRACDGATSQRGLAQHLARQGMGGGEEAVALALSQLGEAGLLDQLGESAATGITRREFGRRASRAGMAAALVPVVASITVPAAMAASSATCGGTCHTDKDCQPAGINNSSECHCTTARNGDTTNYCVPKHDEH